MLDLFRILVVDDEEEILTTMSNMLRGYPAYVDTATNNQEALAKFKQTPYDLVSLDMNMPDFDGRPNKIAGLKLLEKLREIDPYLPIVILSGEDKATIQTGLLGKELRDVQVFVKGRRRAELYTKVNTLLKESEISLLAAGQTEPRFFNRKDVIKLRGVITQINNEEGQLFIEDRAADIPPALLNTPWLARAGYGKLREEPVEIIGVRDNRFIVIATDQVIFLNDCYWNKILVHKEDIHNIGGQVVVSEEEEEDFYAVSITSSTAPEYLTAKRYWEAVSEEDQPLSVGTEVDIIGIRDNQLVVRTRRIWLEDDKGKTISLTQEELPTGFLGQVVKPIGPHEEGTIVALPETKSTLGLFGKKQESHPLLEDRHWLATTEADSIFIPGEKVEIIGLKEKRLIIREYIEED